MSMKKNDFEEKWNEVFLKNKKLNPEDDAKIWNKIHRKINHRKAMRKNLVFSMAAVVLIGGIFFFLKLFYFSEKMDETNYFTSRTTIKIINLSDGSVIKLLPNSTLTLDKNFNEDARKISFTGQGIFNISKNKDKPFKINAKEFSVQVLGTKFFLDQNSAEKKVKLYEGKVKIDHHGKITYLLPNEIWSNSVKNSDYHYHSVEAVQSFKFDNITFDKVIVQLEKEYGVEISYPKQFNSSLVSGSFSGNLTQILEIISYPFNLKPEIKNESQIILK